MKKKGNFVCNTQERMNNTNEDMIKQILTDYLKVNKMRCTPERYAILKAIYSINGSFDIETLLTYMEKNEKFRVSRATIYNTIALLINANLVTHHQFGQESRYEKCFNSGKGHMVCTNCNKVVEINNMDLTDKLTANIKKFHLTHYSLYIYGLCNKCHQAAKRRRAKVKKS